ncbi:MAG: N-acetylmuramoyl-L-alanine amidase [Chitinophagales bacterium]|nr:N-acetylmuramoyl-L-alanine amidase [Chitinophagaceae bacterium]MCB9065178.1 N-acetylmuramoyl-L-alanine amidase [Chitinophagales bacterium]
MPTKALLVILFFCIALPSAYADKKKVEKIVLDAGHGGNEPGAMGRISKEKDLALQVTLKLGKKLEKNLRGRQIIYTRTTDVYPKLPERHKIANEAKADLFISIHVNSSGGKRIRVQDGYRYVTKNGKQYKQARYKYVTTTSASGTECFVLGLHRNDQKEGAIGEYGESVTEEPGLLDPNDPMTAIIIAQYSQAFLENSVLLGTKIQEQFASQNRLDRGVKQKGLEVLAGSAMPGVLVEIGFINNEEEEQYMNSEQGQDEIVEAIYKGILAYISSVER